MPEIQCPSCHGSAVELCSACGGMGGHPEPRTDYDWEGNPIYSEDWVTCYSCSGGWADCTRCGGTGTAYG